MKFWEAMKALDEGKKVCLWKFPSYEFDSVERVIANLPFEAKETLTEFFNSEWELYEDSEK